MSLKKLPGMIDVHTHLRDPGATQKEDLQSGTTAALAGGVTLILDMPNNPIPTISLKALQQKERIAKKKAVCDYGFIFGASQDDNTNEFKKVIPRVCALKLYLDQTTGTLLVEKLATLEKIFQMWNTDKPIMIHAEEVTLAKALSLSYLYKRRIHLCHVSLKEEVILIKKAKGKGMKVTAEATPHHLFLTTNDISKLGPYGMMKPPLRSEKDIAALWQGIKEGVIDIVATDHAPHTREEKQAENPSFGVPGLESALPLLLTAVRKKRITIEKVIELYHENPKKIFRLPQQKNTYIEVDLESKWSGENLKTKCDWTPFKNLDVYGVIKTVVLRGSKVYKEGQLVAKPGFGKRVSN